MKTTYLVLCAALFISTPSYALSSDRRVGGIWPHMTEQECVALLTFGLINPEGAEARWIKNGCHTSTDMSRLEFVRGELGQNTALIRVAQTVERVTSEQQRLQALLAAADRGDPDSPYVTRAKADSYSGGPIYLVIIVPLAVIVFGACLPGLLKRKRKEE